MSRCLFIEFVKEDRFEQFLEGVEVLKGLVKGFNINQPLNVKFHKLLILTSGGVYKCQPKKLDGEL